MLDDDTPGRAPAVRGALVGRVLGLVFALAVVWFFVILGIGPDQVRGFIDPPSILFVFGPVAALWILAPGGRFPAVVWNVMTGRVASVREAKEAEHVCLASGRVAMGAGVLGSLVGLINMLSGGISDPDALSMGCAVMLITALYGVLLWMLAAMAAARMRLARLEVEHPAIRPDSEDGRP